MKKLGDKPLTLRDVPRLDDTYMNARATLADGPLAAASNSTSGNTSASEH